MFKKMILLGLLLMEVTGSLLAGNKEKILKKEVLNKGFIIAYGKFIPRPYHIKLTNANKIYINDILYYPRETKRKSFMTKEQKEKAKRVHAIRDSIRNYYTENFNKYGFEKAKKNTLRKYKNHKIIKKLTINKYEIHINCGEIFNTNICLDPRNGDVDMTSYFTDVIKIPPMPKPKKNNIKKEKEETILNKYNNLMESLNNDGLVTFCEYNNYGNLSHTQKNTYKLVKIIKDYHNGKVLEKVTKLHLGYLPRSGMNKYYLYSVDKNDIEKIYQILSKEVKR